MRRVIGFDMEKQKRMIDKIQSFVTKYPCILSAVIIGSQARVKKPADEYSDIDIILISDDSDYLIHSVEWIHEIGDFDINFLEDTLAGAKERRVIFANNVDVDFIILSVDSVLSPDKSVCILPDYALSIFKSGFIFLKDQIGFEKYLLESITKSDDELIESATSFISQTEFDNMCNDFYYHCVWTAKKIARGELLTAKNCLDRYMKDILVRVIELIEKTDGKNTWYDGRFIETWAESDILDKLSNCYALYDELSLVHTLLDNIDLFSSLLNQLAQKHLYTYNSNIEKKALQFIGEVFRKYITYAKIHDFSSGLIVTLLEQAYSFDDRYIQAFKGKWIKDDQFFQDNPSIADKFASITVLAGKPIGYNSWDPRELPNKAIIGDNCILPLYKGLGFGKLQLSHTIGIIKTYYPQRIEVSTDVTFYPAQNMYKSVGFIETARGKGPIDDVIEYSMTVGM